MRKIIFSKHSIEKLEILKDHNIFVDKEFIINTINNPDLIESGYKGRTIAQKILDGNHVLRVVYEQQKENIKVVTMYPGRRKRYEKDKI